MFLHFAGKHIDNMNAGCLMSAECCCVASLVYSMEPNRKVTQNVGVAVQVLAEISSDCSPDWIVFKFFSPTAGWFSAILSFYVTYTHSKCSNIVV